MTGCIVYLILCLAIILTVMSSTSPFSLLSLSLSLSLSLFSLSLFSLSLYLFSLSLLSISLSLLSLSLLSLSLSPSLHPASPLSPFPRTQGWQNGWLANWSPAPGLAQTPSGWLLSGGSISAINSKVCHIETIGCQDFGKGSTGL